MIETTTRPATPLRIGNTELAAASCSVCRATIHVWASPSHWTSDGRGLIYFDREDWAELELLSLHPCIHEWAAEDFDDPDWGSVCA